MEIVQELSNQYILYIPVALVIIIAISVFTFGFKSAEQPPFDKLSLDDRKSAGKKRKTKEKKPTANGHISTVDHKSDKSPSKDSRKSPSKEASVTKQEKKDKKPEKREVKKQEIKKPEEIRNKKNLNKVPEKPSDFDDGNWETVPLKSEKKKKDQSPVIKDKKVSKKEKEAKAEKAELEKLVKEVVNKELREIEKEVAEEKKVEEPVKVEEIVVVEEKKDKKKKEKKPKKESVEKPIEEAVIEREVEKELKAVVKEVTPVKPVEITKTIEEPVSKSSLQEEAVPAFDELGDTWTESKAAKKTSKKKARRDN